MSDEPIYDHGIQTYSLVPVPYMGDEMVREEHHDYYSRGDWVHTEDHDRVVAVLLGLLEEHTEWSRGRGRAKTIPPMHGPCCTCVCGYMYDDCVCDHNAIEAVLREAGIVGGGDE